jgi:radical SAM superfamily enzyme YgiQ (UPF0313 family)
MHKPPEILLATINAKWIHPSLALRLLKANLGELENRCNIIEFALRQPLHEKIDPILAARPRILGLSVSIWNHTATLELLKALGQIWAGPAHSTPRPTIILGGPEVSYLPEEAEIFQYADFCVRGEGERAFAYLCREILSKTHSPQISCRFVNHSTDQVNVNEINSAYRLYTDEDLRKKLVYVEASRGCAFNCEFCLSAVKPAERQNSAARVREFPLEPFLAEMDELLRRGARTFKFLDRTFNLNISRSRRIMEFFLERIENCEQPPTLHFEMVPSRFPPELRETLARFPPGALRLETGIQTLNPEVSARINRPADPERELETIRFLREQTGAIIHADLIAGLPGEDLTSFANGFNLLCHSLIAAAASPAAGTAAAIPQQSRVEIQLGILKLLPGAPIARHTQAFGMRYNPAPPYEVMETAALPARDLNRIKNFARFWELIVNRGLAKPETLFPQERGGIFEQFMALSDSLLARFGRNWGIDKHELRQAIEDKT